MKLINSKSILFLVVGLLCAVILLFVGGRGDSKNTSVTEITVADYETKIEERLCVLISELKGVSDVSVMATVECGIEYVYATNNEITDSAERNEYYSAGDEEALLLKEISPKVMGVAVVCKGGDNAMVKTNIIQLVSSVLDLPSNRIFVGS